MARKPRIATRQKAVATKPRLPDPKQAKAAIQFAGKGYPVMELEGGFRTWKESGFEVET